MATRIKTRDSASKEVVKIEEPTGALPSFLADLAKEDSGKGVSRDQSDNIVPLIYVLQALSPQCNKRGPDYIEGAEDGAIWLRNSSEGVVSGEDGILFQPCYFQKDWVEWVPRAAGGGFAGRHDEKPGEAVEKSLDPEKPDRLSWVLPNGNTVMETRYHIGYVHLPDGRRLPYVIPMSSSAHTVSRGWMFLMNSKSSDGGKTVAPAWMALYRLRTKAKTKNGFNWSLWDVSDAGWIQSADDYTRGLALYNSFEGGEKIVEAPASQDIADPISPESAAM